MRLASWASVGLLGLSIALVAVPALQAQVTIYKSDIHVFTLDDLLGDFEGTVYGDDPTILCLGPVCDGEQPILDSSGVTLYPIDNTFTFDVTDFVGAEEKPRDGVYEEGWIGEVEEAGEVVGVMISNAVTQTLKSGNPKGTWCAGLGGGSVKCSTEHFTVLEHVLTCDETVPYFYYDPITGLPSDPIWEACEELEVIADEVIADLDPNENSVVDDIAVGADYSVTVKDDGKPLYRWGTLVKRPTDVRLYARIPLPAEWKEPGAVFQVNRAQLWIEHTVTNNPNDQVRPEDFENEAARGQLPRYVEQPDGTWVSEVDCYQGNGTFIPAGTVLRNPAFARADAPSSDLREGFTNAWYTTIDRDPFDWDLVADVGPRWRLQANKFGQDIPGLEIPDVTCSEPPFAKGNIRYEVGELTITKLNLLDWEGDSPLALSTGWFAYLDGSDGDPGRRSLAARAPADRRLRPWRSTSRATPSRWSCGAPSCSSSTSRPRPG